MNKAITYALQVNLPPDGFTDPEDRQAWCEFGPRAFVALNEGQIVGALYWFPVDADGNETPEIRKLWVDPKFQRQGIATKLVNVLADTTTSDIIVGKYLPEGRKFFDAYYATRDDAHRFIEDFEPDLEAT